MIDCPVHNKGLGLVCLLTLFGKGIGMQIPQLQISTQMARIGMKQQFASIEMKQPKADISIEQPMADISMQTKRGKLTIDQSQVWEEMNVMNTLRWNEKVSREALQIVKEGTARRAEDGAQLIDIHTNVNPFVEQAKVNGHRHPKTLSVKYVPSPLAIKYSYEPSEVNINVQENKPIVNVEVNKPNITFHKGTVNIWMENYPTIDIDIVG